MGSVCSPCPVSLNLTEVIKHLNHLAVNLNVEKFLNISVNTVNGVAHVL